MCTYECTHVTTRNECFYSLRAIETSSISSALANTQEFFAIHVMHVPLHTQVFLKFKSSCTVRMYVYYTVNDKSLVGLKFGKFS